MPASPRPRLYVFYHFMHPDHVVSAVVFSELCEELALRGWSVSAYPSNRGSYGKTEPLPARESWRGVDLRRVWRPSWEQGGTLGRIGNALWMIVCWCALAFATTDSPDAILMGTDPIFSVLIAPVWRWRHPGTRIAHWCFDLYPEARYADTGRSVSARSGFAARVTHGLLQAAYRSCDVIADLGTCMRSLMDTYQPNTKQVTLVPWALVEPPAALPTAEQERAAIYGNVKLALMYSGSFGRAHSSVDMLALMRELQGTDAVLALSVKGSRSAQLIAEIDTGVNNVRVVPLAPPNALEARLAAADIHVISLREEWVGTVVPSKFFGALAAGRPVLFCGTRKCSIADWIEDNGLGWVLEPGDAKAVAAKLQSVINEPDRLAHMREHCHRFYVENFAKQVTCDTWDRELRSALRRLRA